MSRPRERGSVMMLMPAAVVIVLLLGAITVDSAIVYLAQRQAYNVAFDAANDTAGAAFDAAAARNEGVIVYRPDRLRAVAGQSVAGAAVNGLRLESVTAATDGTVSVVVEYQVDRLLSPAFLSGADETRQITARSSGELRAP